MTIYFYLIQILVCGDYENPLKPISARDSTRPSIFLFFSFFQ